MKQNEALDLMKMGKNIFLTGAPGSGKTYLLNQYIRYLKDYDVKIAVTASTGIAATHLHGVTIHSWSGIGIKDSMNERELENILTARLLKRNYKNTKILVIDEISMLHKHQLDMVDTIARHMLSWSQPFGGLQVILCGDFFQLPPVSTATSSHETQFAFESDAWKNGNFNICYLQEQHRQGDDPLLGVLQDIRSGTAGEQTKVPLRTRYKKEPVGATKATKLYSRNVNVDAINIRELDNIRAETKVFSMETDGFHLIVDNLKKNCLALEELKLKIGAEVMFIKNDLENKYVNGTRGIVVGFDKQEGWPIVKTYTGKILVAYPVEWKYEDNGTVRAILRQVPLRLAWAITIHKSQGMTLDAAEMDLGDVFELGMGYVALSRVRSLNGLKLLNLNELALKVHPRILEHDKIFQIHSAQAIQYLKTLSLEERLQYQKKTLMERFEGSTQEEIKEKAKKRASKKALAKEGIPTYMVTHRMLKEKLSAEAIAEQRGLTVSTIIHHMEKLLGLKQINLLDISCLKKRIATADFDLIFKALVKSEDGQLKALYDAFNGKYSYLDLKIVRLFVNAC